MPHPTWRERFAQALRDRALPSAKINRLVVEISSHIEDLIAENPGMDATTLVESRLGSPERIADFAKAQLSKVPLWSRPALTFLIFAVGPLFTVALVGLATLLSIVLVALVKECGNFDTPSSPLAPINLTAFAIDYATRVVPLVVTTWLFVSLGRRLDRRSWSIASCGVIAATAMCYTSWVMPKTAVQQGALGLDICFRTDLDHILRAMLPLLLATWMLMRSSPVSGQGHENRDEMPERLAASAS